MKYHNILFPFDSHYDLFQSLRRYKLSMKNNRNNGGNDIPPTTSQQRNHNNMLQC